MLEVMQYLLVTSRGLRSDSELVRCCRFFSPGVFDGAEARRQRHTRHNAEGETRRQECRLSSRPPCSQTLITHSCCCVLFWFFLFRFFRSAVKSAPQASRHAGGEEPHRASPRRHLGPRPHPESPQLRPLGTWRAPQVLTVDMMAPLWPLQRRRAESDLPPVCLPQEEVRPQDTVSVIGGVAGSSKQGRKAAWKFVKDNWEELYNRYQGGFLISRLIKVGTPGKAARVYTQALSFHRLCLCPPPPQKIGCRSSSALFVQKLTGQKCKQLI